MRQRQVKKNARENRGQARKMIRQLTTEICNSPRLQLEAMEAWIGFEEACERSEAARLIDDMAMMS